ncbi:hypothetical protein DMH04_28890 [Kibdelosporangium aridum]|uniref:Uncharacterized protein n=1 Tax=Kibdelosporangium aridum TaxID=2030 RepID=A0A428Z3Z1_KIBAR|nr:hypothetical protein [Kibdelosporangium aridum]RSM80921.1 hypothetical protein DMH04_28890 [Kibdelosporangium aridum]
MGDEPIGEFSGDVFGKSRVDRMRVDCALCGLQVVEMVKCGVDHLCGRDTERGVHDFVSYVDVVLFVPVPRGGDCVGPSGPRCDVELSREVWRMANQGGDQLDACPVPLCDVERNCLETTPWAST